MLIYFLTELLHLFSELHCVAPYLLWCLSLVVFVTSGGWVKGYNFIAICNTGFWYEKIAGHETTLMSVLRLPSSPYSGSHLSETSDNLWLLLREPSCGWDKLGEGVPPLLHPPLFLFIFLFSLYSGLVQIVLENFEYYWDVQTGMFLSVCLILLNVLQILFKVKHLFKNTTRRSTWRLDSWECQAVWESTGKYLGQ